MSDTRDPRKMAVKYLLAALTIAGAFLATAALFAYARNAGIITEALSERVTQVIIGLGFAAYANFMPKMLYGGPISIGAATWMQAVARVGGWAMTLAGLAYAALWAFAPLAFADIASMILILGGASVMVGYGAWRLMACRASKVA